MTEQELYNALTEMGPEAVAWGVIGAQIAIIVMILWYFISAIGYYKMFKKAGESGWKAFIPYLSDYVCFKISYNIKSFWIYLVGALIIQFFSEPTNTFAKLFVMVLAIITLVMLIKMKLRLAKSFGKSTIWGILLIFFPFITSLILGFGNAQYIGNTTSAKE